MLQRPVAIKFLHPDDRGDEESARRLRREAQAAAALDHPNICSIFEVGTDAEGRNFIAMQYVEGETLVAPAARSDECRRSGGLDPRRRRCSRRGPRPRCCSPGPQAAEHHGDAIGRAEAARLRYRPSPARTRKLPGRDDHRFLLADGAGTPAYMAPEVLQGHPADARSDLFSLGVVLYECLTGVVPFQGATPQEILGRVLHVEPEPPSRQNGGVGADLDEVCERLLAKEPGARFQSAAEVRGALQVLRTQSRSLPAPPPRRRNAPVVAAGAAALAVMLSGGWWLLSRTPLPSPPPAAASWYARGIDAVRQGAYVSGRRALEEAVRLFPEYALVSRLAEVLSALDEERNAQAALIRVSVLVPDQARLPAEDRLGSMPSARWFCVSSTTPSPPTPS